MEQKVFIVLLRRPKNDPSEMRSDPFWEFGSFGLTGCHVRNLLNPNKIARLENSRLAFVQGGSEGFKLLLITPGIKINLVKNKIEAKWRPIKPFKYSTAPFIISNDMETDFPYLTNYFLNNDRSTLEGKFASSFRSRTKPLEDEDAIKIIQDFEEYYIKTPASYKILKYWEALPAQPPKVDATRRNTYNQLGGFIKSKC